ncbi:hypothetical protein CCAX7_005100 [Capsulimonas corticalis]|uniref:Uncharacterized protein n=1 Tax=Capsulimonas corticalis TaxID=2219043 RepID=A0A402D2N9_9BACT|nr:gluconate 2-dehydrogenase subunit 3 family protein [Capsulimonas corticalis]BDI28459.1 hypothetical protein CCAX7_005100 [Capsulimonas corticalis]
MDDGSTNSKENKKESQDRIASGSDMEQRVRSHFSRYTLTHYTVTELITMASAIERMAPGKNPMDLAGFMDWATGRLLGRLEQLPGMPNESELFPLGLMGINETSKNYYGSQFHELAPAQRDVVLRSIEDGVAPGSIWQRIPSDYFYRRFYTKVLHGLFAEQKEWTRIGILRSADPTDRKRSAQPFLQIT